MYDIHFAIFLDKINISKIFYRGSPWDSTRSVKSFSFYKNTIINLSKVPCHIKKHIHRIFSNFKNSSKKVSNVLTG